MVLLTKYYSNMILFAGIRYLCHDIRGWVYKITHIVIIQEVYNIFDLILCFCQIKELALKYFIIAVKAMAFRKEAKLLAFFPFFFYLYDTTSETMHLHYTFQVFTSHIWLKIQIESSQILQICQGNTNLFLMAKRFGVVNSGK